MKTIQQYYYEDWLDYICSQWHPMTPAQLAGSVPSMLHDMPGPLHD